MKLLYAIAFALFPLAAPAQTLDSSVLTALCHDDYFEDTADQCSSFSADEGITIEAILEKYGAIITRDTDEEIAIFYLTDPEDVSVGSIQPRHESPTEEYANLGDDDSTAHATIEQSTIAAQIITTASPVEKLDERPSSIPTRLKGPVQPQCTLRPARLAPSTDIIAVESTEKPASSVATFA